MFKKYINTLDQILILSLSISNMNETQKNNFIKKIHEIFMEKCFNDLFQNAEDYQKSELRAIIYGKDTKEGKNKKIENVLNKYINKKLLDSVILNNFEQIIKDIIKITEKQLSNGARQKYLKSLDDIITENFPAEIDAKTF